MTPPRQDKPAERDPAAAVADGDEEEPEKPLPDEGGKERRAEKELAALGDGDRHDGESGAMEMNDSQRAALMNSLNRKDVQSAAHVDPKAVAEVKDLLLLPASVAEKALRSQGGDVSKAVRQFFCGEEQDGEGVLG
ncbi:hypothetical protein BESB_083230 [Besnoitia besnoiti]|uniref:Uncharacterized protein n=1 Tax=Besnoitia besnoiti TaxID=94643 RepID=A0A2A9M7G5_BESBE|nr:hypothetical protein BESB_083230 [Besnoitia besnoiti]PFH33124.1 hypothetical protein BESB_083230 [Besnoitia besnoiti]